MPGGALGGADGDQGPALAWDGQEQGYFNLLCPHSNLWRKLKPREGAEGHTGSGWDRTNPGGLAWPEIRPRQGTDATRWWQMSPSQAGQKYMKALVKRLSWACLPL